MDWSASRGCTATSEHPKMTSFWLLTDSPEHSKLVAKHVLEGLALAEGLYGGGEWRSETRS